MFLKVISISICFKISYDQKCENCDNVGLKSKFCQYFVFTKKKILHRFVSFCISLIFTYCLFVEKKLVLIKHLLSSHLKPFHYFQNISRNCHFVTHFDPPKKLRRKCLIVTNFFSTNKQYLKIKLMQNETNLRRIFLVKTKYW